MVNETSNKNDQRNMEIGAKDEKERLNAVVIYVIYKIESDPLIDECN